MFRTPKQPDARWWRRSTRHHQDARWWRLRWPLAVTAAALAGALLAVRAVRWGRGRKRAWGGVDPVTARPSSARGG